MKFLFAVSATALIAAVAWSGARLGLSKLLGVAVPYAGFFLFLAGMLYRVIRWASTPVPFRITVTCGQQKSLPWIRPEPLDNPQRPWSTAVRMAIETLLFRSLFRNTAAARYGTRIVYGSRKWLWLGAMMFHWALLIIILRHVRLFTEPVPVWADLMQGADEIFHAGMPPFLMTNVMILSALLFLIVRRVADRRLAYISLFQDYFPLILIGAVVVSGMYVRHFSRVDMLAVKRYALSLLAFYPQLPMHAAPALYVHIVMVSLLAAFIPAGKISHMAGTFFSPTRNRAADSRRRRHVNPWNPEVQVHTYAEWEDEFRDKLIQAGYEPDGGHDGK